MSSRVADLAMPWLLILVFLGLLLIAPGDEPPATPYWDYDATRVREAITPAITDTLCPPYSRLLFHEDGTYICTPG